MPSYHVASISCDMALMSGLWGGATTKLMLDSGSSVSLVKKDFVDNKPVKFTRLITNTHINLVTASGDHIPIVDQVEAIVTIGSHTGSHTFLIVHDLTAPVILGLDFFRANKLAIDFTTVPPTVYQRQGTTAQRVCTIVTDAATEEFKDCAIPALNKAEIEYSACFNSELQDIVQNNKKLFHTLPGCTQAACHHIITTAPPVKIPPRRIPVHYKEVIQHQIEDMLRLGIIEENHSPWMSPAVYDPKNWWFTYMHRL